jgi:hypothetical protein
MENTAPNLWAISSHTLSIIADFWLSTWKKYLSHDHKMFFLFFQCCNVAFSIWCSNHQSGDFTNLAANKKREF